MSQFIHIRTNKFPVLAGEKDEVVNPGTYGKAFAEYLQTHLVDVGYRCPRVCCEDWGWWVSVELNQKTIGLTCYREHDQSGDCGFVCGTSPKSNKVWSWQRLRIIDIGEELRVLVAKLRTIFENDPAIEVVSCGPDFPDLEFVRNGSAYPR